AGNSINRESFFKIVSLPNFF
ncbi:hypothetical protein EC900039_4758B, partial [Escherichia coli 90.0039]